MNKTLVKFQPVMDIRIPFIKSHFGLGHHEDTVIITSETLQWHIKKVNFITSLLKRSRRDFEVQEMSTFQERV